MRRKRWFATMFAYLTLELAVLMGVPVRPEQITEMTRLLTRAVITQQQSRESDGDPPPDIEPTDAQGPRGPLERGSGVGPGQRAVTPA